MAADIKDDIPVSVTVQITALSAWELNNLISGFVQNYTGYRLAAVVPRALSIGQAQPTVTSYYLVGVRRDYV